VGARSRASVHVTIEGVIDPVGDLGRILVVDDEPMVRDVVSSYLTDAGFEVECVGDGDRAVEAARRDPPALVVLDVMLPGRDGLSVLRELRRAGTVPVILLTARSDEIDRISGLEFGADDYVVKPFSPRELVARVRSVLRRMTAATAGQPLVFDALRIDPATREVQVDGQAVDLTRREFDLLLFMASAPRQVFSRAQLLEHVWDSSTEWQDPSTVTVHIRRLRAKLERDPEAPRWVRTIWGVGYRFEP
jgi:DNA-binding response OmpR family regulator